MQTFAQQPAILTLAYFAYHCLPSPTIAYLAYYCLPRLPCLLLPTPPTLPTIAYPAYLAYLAYPSYHEKRAALAELPSLLI